MSKKSVFMGILFLLFISKIFSEGKPEITIEYTNSLRIPFHNIKLQLKQRTNDEENCLIWIDSEPMNDDEKFKYSKISIIKGIDRGYFDSLYNSLLNLNYKDIIQNNINVYGTDGVLLKIIFGNKQNNLMLSIWSPEYNSQERKTEELNIIMKELFNKIDLEEWY